MTERSPLLQPAESRSHTTPNSKSLSGIAGKDSSATNAAKTAGRRRLFLAVFATAMASLSSCLSLGYSSPALPDIRQRMDFSDSQSDWFGSLLNVGGMLGALAGGLLLKLVGRKNIMLLSMGVIIPGWICISTGAVPGVLFLGRLITGLSVGLMSIAGSVFLAEVSPKDIRGLLNTVSTMAFSLGVLMSYVLGKWLYYDLLAAACIVPAILTTLILTWLAESPRWLLQVGRHEDALQALQFYQGLDIEDEYQTMKDNVDNAEEFRLSELKQTQLFQPIMLTLLVLFLQQFTGISVFMFYTHDIFVMAGWTLSAVDSSIIVGTVPLFGVGVAAVLTDRLGRKMLLLVSLAVSAVSLAALGAFYHLKQTRDTSLLNSLGWLPLALLCVYFLGFSVGLRPVPKILMGEMLPLRIRGFASGILMVFFFACGALTTKLYHPILVLFGQDGIYWFYASFALVGFVLVAFLLPETKGKSLEELETFFQKKQRA